EWSERTRPQMRNCASGNLEIPGSMLSHRPGMTFYADASADIKSRVGGVRPSRPSAWRLRPGRAPNLVVEPEICSPSRFTLCGSRAREIGFHDYTELRSHLRSP